MIQEDPEAKSEKLDDETLELVPRTNCCDKAVCCTSRGFNLFCRFMGCRYGRGNFVRGPKDLKHLETITLHLNRSGEKESNKRPDNVVTSAKYTVWDFLPLATALQFRRAVNVYFLFQVILLIIGNFFPELFEVSYTPWGTLLVLLFVICITLITEGVDDYQRLKEDQKENNRPVVVLKGKKRMRSTWGELTAGDVIVLKNREICPADVVILQTNRDFSLCNVETSNIDGETNLKIKSASREMHAFTVDHKENWMELLTLQADLEYEEPNALLTFNGTFSFPPSSRVDPIPVGFDSFVLRGSEIRNTSWMLALCVFCGPESKLILSKKKTAPSKFATLDLLMNKLINLAILQSLMFTVVSVCVLFLGTPSTEPLWYMGFSSTLNAYILPGPLAFLLTFINFFSNVVPIDLYITIEIANLCQSFFLAQDLHMYDAGSDTRTAIKTTSLISEIGQVSHIFTDKTGTLTQNIMRLVSLALPTRGRFGYQVSLLMEEDASSTPSVPLDAEPQELFADFVHELKDSSSEEAKEFALALVLCHNVIIDFEESSGKIRYNAESPDEEALVKCIAALGFELKSTENGVYVFNEEAAYHVLAIFPFTSDRKRMSILVQQEGNPAVLYMKGADNVVAERSLNFSAKIELDLNSFAQNGLRTLLFAKREIANVEQVVALYKSAKQETGSNRKAALAKLSDELERDMTIVGSSGIEDALQDGVPETIQMIRDAQIKLWVLTGDKVATAINIGFTAKIITPHMQQLFLTGEKDVDYQILTDTVKALTAASEGIPDHFSMVTTRSLCLICSGSSLEHILRKQAGTDETESLLLTIAQFCDVVLCCRVSPAQKALLVESVNSKRNSSTMSSLVKRFLGRRQKRIVTLSIGDGANDVPMIQAAKVGVGISGREGLQAANNADFSIAQFRFLARLLFVHGRWSYRRNAYLFRYVCYSWQVLVWPLFFYLFMSMVSGQQVYVETYYVTLFAWLCNGMILFMTVFDKDVSAECALDNPKIAYDAGRLNELLNYKEIFIHVVLRGFIHGVLIYYLVFVTFPSDNGSLSVWGSTMYLALFSVMTLIQCQLALTWNWVIIAILCLIIFCFFLSVSIVDVYLSYESSVALLFTYSSPQAYAQTGLILAAVIWIEYTFFGLRRLIHPTRLELLMEEEYMGVRRNRTVKHTRALEEVWGALREGGENIFVLPLTTIVQQLRGRASLVSGKTSSGFYDTATE